MLRRHAFGPEPINGDLRSFQLGTLAVILLGLLVGFCSAGVCCWLRQQLRRYVRARHLNVRQLPWSVVMARNVAEKPGFYRLRGLPIEVLRLEVGRNPQ